MTAELQISASVISLSVIDIFLWILGKTLEGSWIIMEQFLDSMSFRQPLLLNDIVRFYEFQVAPCFK